LREVEEEKPFKASILGQEFLVLEFFFRKMASWLLEKEISANS
jgi:hypothetical protein